MTSKLVQILGLTAKDQESIAKTTGRLQTVGEFLIDAVNATKSTNFFSAIAESTPWWLHAVAESAAEAAPPIKFLAKLAGALGKIKDPDRIAYLAFTTAYQRSVEKALLTVGPPSGGPAKDNDWAPTVAVSAPDNGLSFDNYSINDPFNHLFLQQSTQLLNEALTAAAYSKSEIRKIQNEVLIRFPGCLKTLVTHPQTREKFAAFMDSVQYGDREERVRAAWLDHFEFQRYQFEEAYVFGEEPFSLSDIYVETECGVVSCEELWSNAEVVHKEDYPSQRIKSERKEIDPFNEECGGRHDLLGSVMKLIGDKSFRDVIVVQGPAGSGKSAFTLRLSMELLRSGLMPIRIRFRDIPLQAMNIEDALPEAVRFWDIDLREGDLPPARPDELFLNMALFDQSVKYRAATICPYVLILDGWDEVSVAAQKGFAVRIGEILSQIRDRFLTRGNRPIIRVILTGRPSAAVSGSTFFTKQTRLLTIRPLEPSALKKFLHNLAVRLADPKEPERAKPTRFDAVLSRYDDEFRARLENYPMSMTEHGTMEVLGLPLLTHLAVRLMVRWPVADLTPIVENPTTLYRQLTNLTCEKGGRYGDEVYDPGIPGQDLRHLLHETAAAMTVFGRDSIPYDELDIRLSQLNEELFERVQNVTKDHPVTSLMINFFFKGGRTELGAEFLHKSFREFLYAEAVIEALKVYGRNAPDDLAEQPKSHYGTDFGVDDPRYEFSRRLGSLLAPQWLTREVCVFIHGLIQWELSRAYGQELEYDLGSTTEGLSIQEWRRVADGLADLWNWWGEGVHLRTQPKYLGKKVSGWASPYVNDLVHWSMPQDLPKGEVPAAPRTTSMDGHLGDGIFRLSALVHHYLAVPPGDNGEWEYFGDTKIQNLPKVRSYQSLGRRNGAWVARFAPSGSNPRYFLNYVSRVNAAGWYPDTLFPVNTFMRSLYLYRCELHLVPFANCDLSGACLRGTQMSGTFFSGADLRSCDLRGANCFGTSFIGCSMHKAHADDIELIYCVFDGAEPKKIVSTLSKKNRKRGLKMRKKPE